MTRGKTHLRKEGLRRKEMRGQEVGKDRNGGRRNILNAKTGAWVARLRFLAGCIYHFLVYFVIWAEPLASPARKLANTRTNLLPSFRSEGLFIRSWELWNRQ